VILNDNDMSIAPPTRGHVGLNLLPRLVSGGAYRSIRDAASKLASHLPRFFYDKARKAEEFFAQLHTGGTMFEELGSITSAIDGHNLDHLLPVLNECARPRDDGPVLVHVITRRARLRPGGASDDKYHASINSLSPPDSRSSPRPTRPELHQHFRQRGLVAEAEARRKNLAITAAMRAGPASTSSARLSRSAPSTSPSPEQHAVTFAAGLAARGYKPFCARFIRHSSRAGYDQVVHDVAVQHLPVRFAIDRAGLVGADDPTHAGLSTSPFSVVFRHGHPMPPPTRAELTIW